MPEKSAPVLAAMLDEMTQALNDEIEALNKNKRIKHHATNGRLLSEGSGQYIYQFTLDDPWEPQDDDQLSIATEADAKIPCTVITSAGTTLTIASESPLSPAALRQIDLYDDSTELLMRLKDALQQADEGQGRLGTKCFGLLPSDKRNYTVPIQCQPFVLREKQEQAAILALGGEVTFIVGPPGTGKTATLAAIALQHLRAGQSVLIAAHTNIAIDNALMKLCDLCKDAGAEALLANGQIVRYGAVQKEELKTNDRYQEIYLPKITRQQNSALNAQHEQIKIALAELDQQIQALEPKEQPDHAQAELQRQQISLLQQALTPLQNTESQRRQDLQQKQQSVQNKLSNINWSIKQLGHELAQTEALISEQEPLLLREEKNKEAVLQKLVAARAMPRLVRLFKGIQLEKLELQMAETGMAVAQLQNALERLKAVRVDCYERFGSCQQQKISLETELHTIQLAISTPSKEADEVRKLQEQLQMRSQHLAELESQLKKQAQHYQQQANTLIAKRTSLETQIAEIDKKLRDIEKSIVANARIIGTTLTKTYSNQTVNAKRFHAVILDEVSMAAPPLVYLAAAHADSSVTLIGDPQQLAPICSAETVPAKQWLKRDLFTLRDISLETANGGREQSILLNVQSRMHPAIATIANKWIYQNRLLNDYQQGSHNHIAPQPDSPLVLCDTSDAAPTASRPTARKSRQNYYHALCCLALARQILSTFPTRRQNTERRIGIVTPYAPQARLIQRLIKNAELHNEIQAGTVHRFQGLEFDVVIFDTVEAPGLVPGDFISGGYGSDSMRLINVAVTRPRQKLYLLAHLPYLRRTLSEHSTLRQAVEETAKVAILPSLQFTGTHFATLVDSLHKLEPATNYAQASLIGTALSTIPAETYKQIVPHDILIVQSPPKESRVQQTQTEIKHLTEDTLFAMVVEDIRNARQSICIASPYIATKRLVGLLDLLLEQKRRGLHLEIFTKPLTECEEDWHQKAVKMMLDRGLEPVYRASMHEKALIIDKTILYHGSLNFLSHADTTESILRITNSIVIEEVYKAFNPRKARSHEPSGDSFQNVEEISISFERLSTSTRCACETPLIPIWRKDGSGIYFRCAQKRFSGHENIEKIHLKHFEHINEVQNCACVKRGSSMVLQVKDWPLRVALICKAQCGERIKVTMTGYAPTYNKELK